MKCPNRLFISNEWVCSESGETVDVINPANEEQMDNVPLATAGDVERALKAAAEGFDVWRRTDAWTRSRKLAAVADWLKANKETVAQTLTEEQGKPLPEAVGEINATAEQFEWYAGEAMRVYGRLVEAHSIDHRILVERQPIGPVAAFSPWNFPALLTARKMAPAIACGCSVLVKPPIEAPRTALWLAEACRACGLPAGVVGMVTGRSSHISRQLIASPVIRKVSLTGSVPVGKELMRLCAEEIKPMSMELGGHSAVLVFADADVEDAAEKCARAKYRNNGQVCISASRFFVQEPALDRFTKRFVEVTATLKVGDGRQHGTDVGPLANRKRLQATEALVQDALEKGARVAVGGARPDGAKKGFYYLPTVLVNVDSSMAIMQEEPFCPVAPITSFSTLEDGLAKANATPFGLAGYVFTRDTRTAFLASEGLDCGMVGVNNLLLATAEAPFGGVKHSGFGREGGIEWMESYTIPKYINIKL